MRRIEGTSSAVLMLVFAAVAGAVMTLTPNPAMAQVATGCTDAALSGSYAYQGIGAAFIGPDGTPQPGGARVDFAVTGWVAFDGRGAFTFTEMASIGGMVLPRNGTGTYSVAGDCTATAVASFASGEVEQLYLVLARGGEEAYFMTTGQGSAIVAALKKQ